MLLRAAGRKLAWIAALASCSVVELAGQGPARVIDGCGQAAGHGLVVGQVLDIETGLPLPYSQIWTPIRGDIACATIGDSAGVFALWLEPGSHLLAIDLLSYCLADPVAIEVGAGDSIQVTVKMRNTHLSLDGQSQDPAVIACQQSWAAWRHPSAPPSGERRAPHNKHLKQTQAF